MAGGEGGRRCAFLTTHDAEPADDRLAHGPLAALGWRVENVPWRESVDWSTFDAVVIRSPWDYHREPESFLRVLETIDRSRARLENPLELVRWNVEKTYLRDLSDRGVPIVPSFWYDAYPTEGLDEAFDRANGEELVVKPIVSASAEDTFRLTRTGATAEAGRLAALFADRPFMAQPLMSRVLDEGEFSLFYFDGHYSHAVLKTPAPGDFRVQEEHGGRTRPTQPPAALTRTADAALAALDRRPLYARVDLVRSGSGDSFRLMELELIEPALYLGADPAAPGRFARALHRRA